MATEETRGIGSNARRTDHGNPTTMASKTQNHGEAFAHDHALTELFGDHPKVKILAALLSESEHDITISDIARLADVHRTTVYDHLDDLTALGVVEHTRKAGGSPLFQINKESPITNHISKLEMKLLERIDQAS